MAYTKKRTYRKKKTYKKRAYTRNTGGHTASRALALARKTMELCKPELKFQDFDEISTIPNQWLLAQQWLNAIQQGVPPGDKGDRIGDSIRVQTLTGRLSVYMPPTTNCTSNAFRIVILRVRTPLTAAVNPAVIFENNNTYQSPKRFDTRFQSKTLWDKTFTLSVDGQRERHINVVIPINMRSQYDQGSTLVTNNQYVCMVCADPTSVGGDNLLVFSQYWRLTYTDA